MVALSESLVEWTVLALAVAIMGALVLRARTFAHWARAYSRGSSRSYSHYCLSCVALTVIVANLGIAATAAAAAARSEAAATGVLLAMLAISMAYAGARRRRPATAAAGSVSDGRGGVVNLAAKAGYAATAGRAVVAGSAAVQDRVAFDHCTAIAGGGAPAADAGCTACPECVTGEVLAQTTQPVRKRARGVTITRLGGA